MATVELRDIVTEADREAAIALRRGPGQDAFVSSVEKSLADAITYAEACPRFWTINYGDDVVGFMMISDGIPAEMLAQHWDSLIGPYFLWRLLIDEGRQHQGYGSAAIDALVVYLRDRPGAEVLYVSCGQGDGSPQPFYERYGFVPTGGVIEGEIVLALDLTAG